MAMPLKSAKIDGEELKDVVEAEVEIVVPTRADGTFSGAAHAVRIRLLRDVSRAATVAGYGAATREDGRYKNTTCELVFQDQAKKEAWTLTAKEAFVSRYRMIGGNTQTPTYEEIQIHAGDVEVDAGGEKKSFKLHDFSRTAK